MLTTTNTFYNFVLTTTIIFIKNKLTSHGHPLPDGTVQ
jgi:hypothetical protein